MSRQKSTIRSGSSLSRRAMGRGPFVSLLALMLYATLGGHALERSLAQTATEPSTPGNTESAADEEAAAPEIDFITEIRPILAAHCFSCHGPEKRSGGLRLDELEFAKEMGYSGLPILGGTLETNELLHRVASDERTYRMPKNAPALAMHEVDLIRRWVAAGTPWPALKKFTAPPIPWYLRWIDSWGRLADRHKFEFQYLYPFAAAFVALQVGLLVVARVRASYRDGKRRASRPGWFGRFCQAITSRELAMAWLLLVALFGLAIFRASNLRLSHDLSKAELARNRASSQLTGGVFGNPPKPVRPDHPKQVAGTYYRGNCERNPSLFNNGNYLTATFRISVCDDEHRPIDVGDPLPQGQVWIKVELDRAPGTADALYSPEMIASVYLCHTYNDGSIERMPDDDKFARLEVVEPAQRWVAYCRTKPIDENQSTMGLIYIYTGRLNEKGIVQGDAHYGIEYQLSFAGGTLSDSSDLWMNAFGNAAFENPRTPGKAPFTEWFDFRPIPVITGENSSDPKLLGLEEYVKKGLIDPARLRAAEDDPEKPAEHERPPTEQQPPVDR